MGAGFIVFCCFIPAMIFVWVIITAIFATFLGGVTSSLHHPGFGLMPESGTSQSSRPESMATVPQKHMSRQQ